MWKLKRAQINDLPSRMTAAEFRLATGGGSGHSLRDDQKPVSKMRNQPIITEDGFFHSTGESERWQELKLLAAAGLISDLQRQVKFTLEVDGIWISDYYADFTYIENRILIVEDFKGAKETGYFQLKKRLFFAVKKIEIRLTRKLKKKEARAAALAPAIAAAAKKSKMSRRTATQSARRRRRRIADVAAKKGTRS